MSLQRSLPPKPGQGLRLEQRLRPRQEPRRSIGQNGRRNPMMPKKARQSQIKKARQMQIKKSVGREAKELSLFQGRAKTVSPCQPTTIARTMRDRSMCSTKRSSTCLRNFECDTQTPSLALTADRKPCW